MPEVMQHSEGPFHRGELQVQDRVGVREEIAPFAGRMIRDHMPDQHRAFFAQLPFLILGAVDEHGRPWASLIAGQPGFIGSPDPRRLEVAGVPFEGDPVLHALADGADVGVLGIELETRRRNRATGRIARTEPGRLAIAIDQSFGNCPQYIQMRQVEPRAGHAGSGRKPSVLRSNRFDAATVRLIKKTDTLFIATAFRDDDHAASQGADVSHRGGKPGFVRIDGEATLTIPDFSGNKHFNTLGNLQVNPRAGLLFPDFDSGDLVLMTGTAEMIWDGPDVEAFDGAERLLRFTAGEILRLENALPFRFTLQEYSPVLRQTDTWPETSNRLAAASRKNGYRPFEIYSVEKESESITSFLLRPADGGDLPDYKAGQFLPIRVTIPGRAEPALRTYTLSEAPGRGRLRISVKNEGKGALVSAFLHDRAKPGFLIEAKPPQGGFVLDPTSKRPSVLISAGVGITPMIAMAEALLADRESGVTSGQVHFIHGARSGRDLAFGRWIREMADKVDGFKPHIRFSRPGPDDVAGDAYDSVGRVDIDLLKSELSFDDYDFYLCGPGGFMDEMVAGLLALGISENRIKSESFGPPAATVAKGRLEAPMPAHDGPATPVPVRFSKSDITANWDPQKGSLLELAEEAGLNPDFGCRSGSCGSCAVPLLDGAVRYLSPPSAQHDEAAVLLCQAVPTGPVAAGSGESPKPVVLDL